MLDSRENNTEIVPPVNLSSQLISICIEYRKDYFFTRNTHDFIAHLIIKLATYINDLQKFGCLKFDERDEYKQLLLRNLILALRQYLRGKLDEKFSAKIVELISNNDSMLIENKIDIAINADAICMLVEVFSQHNTNVNFVTNRCIKIFESHLESYTSLHSEKLTSISDLPTEMLDKILKLLPLGAGRAFGLTCKQNFSLFNSDYHWESELLGMGLASQDIDSFVKHCCRRDQSILKFLVRQLPILREKVGRFNKQFMVSHHLSTFTSQNIEILFQIRCPSSSLLKGMWITYDAYSSCVKKLSELKKMINDLIDDDLDDEVSKAWPSHADTVALLMNAENEQSFFAMAQNYTFNYVLLYNLYLVAERSMFTNKLIDPLDTAMLKTFPSLSETLLSLAGAKAEFDVELRGLLKKLLKVFKKINYEHIENIFDFTRKSRRAMQLLSEFVDTSVVAAGRANPLQTFVEQHFKYLTPENPLEGEVNILANPSDIRNNENRRFSI